MQIGKTKITTKELTTIYSNVFFYPYCLQSYCVNLWFSKVCLCGLTVIILWNIKGLLVTIEVAFFIGYSIASVSSFLFSCCSMQFNLKKMLVHLFQLKLLYYWCVFGCLFLRTCQSQSIFRYAMRIIYWFLWWIYVGHSSGSYHGHPDIKVHIMAIRI